MTKISNISGMPQMRRAFVGWTTKITLRVIKQYVNNDTGYVQAIEKDHCFAGTIQPLDPEKIKLKPEGQQSWEWLQIHCVTGDFNLTTNDRIIYCGVKFKVMARYDYSLNNFIEYHLIKDFEDGVNE